MQVKQAIKDVMQKKRLQMCVYIVRVCMRRGEEEGGLVYSKTGKKSEEKVRQCDAMLSNLDEEKKERKKR